MNIIDAGLTFKSGHEIRTGAPGGIVLHHAASNGSVDAVHNGHINRGWVGIGYHFYVRKDGKVYRGRPENWIGAHTVGHNAKLGICAEGNFQNDTMPDVQKNAIIEVIIYLRKKYGNLTVYRHKDFAATACPGANYPFNEILDGAKITNQAQLLPPGTIVNFTGARHYISANTGTGKICKPGLAEITKTLEGAQHPYHIKAVKDGGSDVYGWVDAEYIAELEQPSEESENCNITLPVLRNGSEGKTVKAMQLLLIGFGYPCGDSGADSIFGSDTETAVKMFQGDHMLTVSGICDADTWESLTK